MSKDNLPRKFRISITEVFHGERNQTLGKATAKTLDIDDIKPIYELFKKAAPYSEKHGQRTKINNVLQLD